NFGFETGDLTGWNVGPISLGGSVQVLQSFPLLKESYYPKEGSYFACLGTSYEGTSMSLEKIMHLGAGQSISGWAAFVARTCNTYAVVQILDEFGSVIATPWYADDSSVGASDEDPWTAWSWTAPSEGIFTINYLIVREVGEVISTGSSYALFDGEI
ncbi:MAG: hypothetical protein ACXABV_19455, partial [Candidatus Thorarchaeota archaeon]